MTFLKKPWFFICCELLVDKILTLFMNMQMMTFTCFL